MPTVTIVTKEKRCRSGWVLLELIPDTVPSCASPTSPTATTTTTTPKHERPCKTRRFAEVPPNLTNDSKPTSENASSGSSSYPPSPADTLAEIDGDYILVDMPHGEHTPPNKACTGLANLGLVARMLVENKEKA